MAKAESNKGGKFRRVRGWTRAVVSRVIRRGFFRIVLLLFVVLVAIPFAGLQLLANQSSGNAILRDFVVGEVFNTDEAEVTWDEDRTEFTGPSIALTGTITYYDLKVRRKAGATPHPRGQPLEYDFLSLPRVEIAYDLKRLPDLPVTTVRIAEGLTLYFNIYRGQWLDQNLFKTGDDAGAAPPSLPQIITDGACTVNLRADGILVPPESLSPGEEWYELVVRELSLLPDPVQDDLFAIGGRVDSRRFGRFDLGGRIAERAQSIDVGFRSSRAIEFNRQYAGVLAPDVRRVVEQFQIEAMADLDGGLKIEPGQELQFEADVRARDGKVCFVDFPVQVEDVTADIRVRNNNISVDATGRRGSAEVNVEAQVDSVGTDQELLQLDVNIRDLLVDEEFRLALLPARLQPDNLKNWQTGEPYSPEEWNPLTHAYFDPFTGSHNYGYPEWSGPPLWKGGILYPDVADVIPFVCRAFTPMGLADFQLTLKQETRGIDPDTGRATSDQFLDWKVMVRDATAAFTGLPEDEAPGFPVPLHGVYGVIEGSTSPTNPGRYIIRGFTGAELEQLGLDGAGGYTAHDRRGLTGTLASPGERVWVYGVFNQPAVAGEEAKLSLEFQTEGVDFNQRIKQRIPEGIREVIAPYAPEGKVDVQRASLTIWPNNAERDLTYDFTLAAKNVAAQYQFPDAPQPARFREVAGTITVASDGNQVTLSNLRGQLLNSPITINLRVADSDLPSFAVESNDFGIRPEITDIMPPALGNAISRFDPRGFVRFEVTGRRSETEPDFTKADVSFLAGSGDRSGSVSFDAFPYALTDVTGRFFVNVSETWTEIVIRDFAGRGSELPGQTTPSRVEINGYVLLPMDEAEEVNEETEAEDNGEPAGALGNTGGLIFDLTISTTRIPVDNSLMSAMTTMLAEPGTDEKPALVEFIEMLRLSGTFGTEGRLVMGPDGEMDWLFEIILEGAGVDFVNFPYPLAGLYGSVIVDGYDVSLRNVEGDAEVGTFTLHSATYSGEEGWQLAVSARDMSFHQSPSLRRALPSGLRDVLARLDPRGTFDIDMELSGKDDYLHYDISLDVFSTDVDLGLHFDNMSARIDMEGVFEGDSSRQNGSVYVREVFFKKSRFNDVTTSVQYFDGRVEFPNLRGRFYEGFLEGRFGIEEDGYSGEIEIRRANLKQLGETAFPDAGQLQGALDGEIRFHSQPDQFGQIGRGRLDVQPIDRSSSDPALNTARLAPVPLFDAIASAVGDEQNFDEGHVYFWLGPERMTIRQMDFVSDSARIEVFGGNEENYIVYDTAQMRMKLFFTLAPRSPIPLPVVQQVLDLLKQILFPLYVTGTLNDPSVEPFSLTAEDLEEEPFPRRPSGS